MLLYLIKPFIGEDPERDEIGRMLALAIVAWNMASTRSLGIPGFKNVFESTMEQEGFDKNEIETVKKLEKEKQKNYPEDASFIEKFELNYEGDGTLNLSVTCKSMMDMMEENGIAKEMDEMQFEQGFVNRSAISLKYKPAYLEWLKQNDELYDPLQPRDSTIYLIEEKDSLKETSQWLRKNFTRIMTNELEDVTFDENKWPKRTYKVFCDLFEIQFHDMVMDLDDVPVIKNEQF